MTYIRGEHGNRLCRECKPRLGPYFQKCFTCDRKKKCLKSKIDEGYSCQNCKPGIWLGKHLPKKTRLKISKANKGKKYSKEVNAKKSMPGSKNGMYGQSVYDLWVKKYGIEEAEKRKKIRHEKMSKSSSGKNNPMYGKPTPQGSGNGWSGWYKGWYFRSILELSYFIQVIERFNLSWKSADGKKEFQIKYDYLGKNKTYTPDFLINDKYVIEIKPKKLSKTPYVQAKAQAAKKWCNENGYIYKITCVSHLDTKLLVKLVENRSIKLLVR